ncbi:MAG: SurA N-terminal domain-containing protein [Acidiferrobacterales bacterium]
MLSAIREKTHGIIAAFILALIIIPFAFFGMSSYFTGDVDINVAEVNGIEISQDTYRNALNRFLASNIDPSIVARPEFKQQVLDSLVEEVLLTNNTLDEGYRTGDAELGRLIRTAPEFQRNGAFDPELYSARLRQEGLNQQAFEERLRSRRVSSQIQSGFAGSVLLLPAERAAVQRLWQQMREFDYVIIRPGKFSGSIDVSEEEIKAYYELQPVQFKIPEQVRIEYIRLSAPDLAEKYHATEEELRRTYEQDVTLYSIPEQRRISHILIELPADAEMEEEKKALAQSREIEKKLRAGADFAALAKELSADSGTAEAGGDLGYVERGTLPKELEVAAFGLKAGEISEPVRTSFGFHIAKLTELKPGSRKSFAEARPDLEKALRQRRGEEEFYEKFEQMSNLVYEQADSLASAAEALGLEVMQSGWFGREGGQDIATQPRVVEAAFSPEVLVESRNSDAIEIDRENLVALRVVGHREAVRKPLADVRAEIDKRLRKESARERAAALGVELVKRLRAGESLDALAQAQGLELVRVKKVTRLKPEGVDRRLVAAVFKTQRPRTGEATYGEVDLGAGGYGVFALTRVEEGDTDQAEDALKQRVERILNQRRGAGMYVDYVRRLREMADIETHPDRL